VSITDEGIGMDDQRLAAANVLLQAPPPPGLSLSRTLGLHVVAHLAIRYGIRVQLRRAATNGVTALVALPATVLTRASAPEPMAPPAPPVPPAPPAPPAPATAAAAASADPVVTEAPTVRGEPEVVPPPFDPAITVPSAATPPPPTESPLANAGPAYGLFEVDGDGLPRRVPGTSPLGADADHDTLPRRTPGRHLSHRPAGPAVPKAEVDSRPRPERVHDLLTRHLEGIRDGRGGDRVAGVSAEPGDGEVLP
jgi:hypothetical protein